jgi:stage III sporulation protein AH
MQSYFVARKWLYRAVLALVVLVVAAGVMELNRLVREIKPGKAQAPVSLPTDKAPAVPGQPAATGQGKNPVRTETRDKGELPGKTAKHEFFVEYRLDRDRTRSQRIDMLRETVNNPNLSNEIRKEANRELMSVFRTMEKEMELENLIKAEGFKDTVVYLQEEKTATVTLQASSLTPADREKLVTIFTRHTGLKEENIAFICKN